MGHINSVLDYRSPTYQCVILRTKVLFVGRITNPSPALSPAYETCLSLIHSRIVWFRSAVSASPFGSGSGGYCPRVLKAITVYIYVCVSWIKHLNLHPEAMSNTEFQSSPSFTFMVGQLTRLSYWRRSGPDSSVSGRTVAYATALRLLSVIS